jgi:hypothetical protein
MNQLSVSANMNDIHPAAACLFPLLRDELARDVAGVESTVFCVILCVYLPQNSLSLLAPPDLHTSHTYTHTHNAQRAIAGKRHSSLSVS